MSVSTFAQGSLGVTEVPTSGNVIINGAFDIWQRGTSFSGVASGYTSDRWFIGAGADGVATASRQTIDPGSISIMPEDIGYFFRYSQTTAATSATPGPRQYIEDVRTLAGQVVSFSFYAKANKQIVITPLIRQNFGTGGSPSALVDTYFTENNVTITTSWARYSTSFTIPSTLGKVVGTNSTGYVGLQFFLPLNDTYDLDVTGVQLEAGPVATPFRRNAPSIQAELAACQRYYFRQSVASNVLGGGLSSNTTNGLVIIQLPVSMRATPSSMDFSTLVLSNGTTYTVAVTALTFQSAGPVTLRVVATTSSVQVTNQPVHLFNDTGGFLGFSAEL